MSNKLCYKYNARHGLTCYKKLDVDNEYKSVWIRTSTGTAEYQKNYEHKTSNKGLLLYGYFDTPEKAIMNSLKKLYKDRYKINDKIELARDALKTVIRIKQHDTK